MSLNETLNVLFDYRRTSATLQEKVQFLEYKLRISEHDLMESRHREMKTRQDLLQCQNLLKRTVENNTTISDKQDVLIQTVTELKDQFASVESRKRHYNLSILKKPTAEERESVSNALNPYIKLKKVNLNKSTAEITQ